MRGGSGLAMGVIRSILIVVPTVLGVAVRVRIWMPMNLQMWGVKVASGVAALLFKVNPDRVQLAKHRRTRSNMLCAYVYMYLPWLLGPYAIIFESLQTSLGPSMFGGEAGVWVGVRCCMGSMSTVDPVVHSARNSESLKAHYQAPGKWRAR